MIRKIESRDIDVVNVIRQQVHTMHVEGEPKRFKPNFTAIKNHIYEYIDSDSKVVYVYEDDDIILGYIMADIIEKPESDYRPSVRYIEISELGVKSGVRGRGIGTKLIDTIKSYAVDNGVTKIELNMWEFNEQALAFYDKCGFKTFRRYMEIDV